MKVKNLLAGAVAFFFVHGTNINAQTNTAYSWNHLPTIAQPNFKKDTFNIASFGAKGDGVTLNTETINKAIATCSQKGGGVVLVPGGMWLTGPIVMKSNVNLHVVREAIIQFTADFNQFPLVEGSYEGRRSARCQSPISGLNLVNIAITGKGIIDGNGDAWRMVKKDKLTASEWKRKVASGGSVSADGNTWFPSEKTRLAHEQKRSSTLEPGQTLKDFEDIKDFLRPNLLVFTDCKKVLLEGVTFQNSPAWCLHPIMCEDLTLRNVYVKNPDYAQNGDGVDVESCKNVLIEGSTFDVGDDGICIKSGKDEEGRKRGKPTENVIVRNNVVYKGHGGFVVGSEMSGGARNIFVYDCSFMGTDIGLRFKTARGRGGIVEKIYIKNIRMKDIVHDAILFDMYYFMKPPKPGEKVVVPAVSEATPQFRDFYISNIVCNGAERGIFVRGLPEMSIKDIHLNDLVLQTNKGAEIIEANNIELNNVQLNCTNTKPLIYVENGSNLTFDRIRFSQAEQLFNINGEKSANIKVLNTNTTSVQQKAEFNNGASVGMLQIK
jgi:polygalacturonase